PNCCATSSICAAGSLLRIAVRPLALTSRSAAFRARAFKSPDSVWSHTQQRRTGCSSKPATGRRRTPLPVWVADGRWPGRVCGAWRDSRGRVGTMWACAVEDGGAAESRYLYLRGANRTHLPPYGLFDVLSRPAADPHRDVLLVEGFLDCHQLRARGVE